MKNIRCWLFGHKWHYFGTGRSEHHYVVAVSFICANCGECRIHTDFKELQKL